MIRQSLLIIVPYGIEIYKMTRNSMLPTLIIVPYGIEIALDAEYAEFAGPYNRTIWN